MSSHFSIGQKKFPENIAVNSASNVSKSNTPNLQKPIKSQINQHSIRGSFFHRYRKYLGVGAIAGIACGAFLHLGADLGKNKNCSSRDLTHAQQIECRQQVNFLTNRINQADKFWSEALSKITIKEHPQEEKEYQRQYHLEEAFPSFKKIIDNGKTLRKFDLEVEQVNHLGKRVFDYETQVCQNARDIAEKYHKGGSLPYSHNGSSINIPIKKNLEEAHRWYELVKECGSMTVPGGISPLHVLQSINSYAKVK